MVIETDYDLGAIDEVPVVDGNEVNQEPLDEAQIEQEENLMWDQVFSIFIDRYIKLFPKSIDLLLQSSFVLSNRIQNEFKAIFQLMRAELCEPSLKYRFFIFRRRLTIERAVLQKNQSNIGQGQRVDPYIQYKYEKLNQKFMKLQYFAANSALGFWRELLQRHIDATVLQRRGAEISLFYERIADVAQQLMAIFPNEIKVLHLYAQFLKQIVNNEQEAQVYANKAQHQFALVLQQKNNEGSGGSDAGEQTELTIYGENTAVSIVMLALEAERVGTIIHINDEMQRTLGYLRRNLVGMNIGIIQPSPIAAVHERILLRFMNQTKRTILNHNLQLFALTSERYLRPIHLIIKLYPQMSDRIVIVGFIQSLRQIDGFELHKFESNNNEQLAVDEEQLLSLPHHYLITDANGNIACVTEGLWHEVGLHCKFFTPTTEDSPTETKLIDFMSLVDLEQSIDFTDAVKSPQGLDCVLNTSKVLDQVNIENLTLEELALCKSRHGLYQVNLKLVRLEFASWCIVDLYRVVLYPKSFRCGLKTRLDLHIAAMLEGIANNDEEVKSENSFTHSISSSGNQGASGDPASSGDTRAKAQRRQSSLNQEELISIAADIQQPSTQNKMIQDFKAIITRRDTPRHLVLLGRVLALVIVLSIVLSIVMFSQQLNFIDVALSVSSHKLLSESRLIKYIQLVMNVRSFADIANSLEFDAYSDPSLKRTSRFQYLSALIQREANELNDIEYRLTMESLRRAREQDMENQPIELYQVSNKEFISTFRIPFKYAMSTYLNDILSLGGVDSPPQVALPPYLALGSPFVNRGSQQPQLNADPVAKQRQKDMWFLLVNGLRTLLLQTFDANDGIRSELYDNLYVSQFIGLMIAEIVVTTVFICYLIYSIAQSERNKLEIMSVFSILSTEDVKLIYDQCDHYIDRFDNGQQFTELLNPSTAMGDGLVDGNPEDDILNPQAHAASKRQSDAVKRNLLSKLPRLSQTMHKRTMKHFNDNEPEESKSEDDSEFEFLARLRQKRGPSTNWHGLATSHKAYYGRMINLLNQIMKQDLSVPQKVIMSKMTPAQKLQVINKKAQFKNNAEELKQSIFRIHTIRRESVVSKWGGASNQGTSPRRLPGLSRQQTKQLMAKFNPGAAAAPKKKESNPHGSLAPQKHSQGGHEPTELFDSSAGGMDMAFQDSQLAPLEKPKKHNDSSSVHSDSESEDDLERQRKRRLQELQSKSISEQMMQEEESRSRKRMLQETSKEGRRGFWKLLVVNCLVSLFFYCYFVDGYLYHKHQLSVMAYIQESSPVFLSRYTNIFLAFAFMREKIVNNNEASTSLGFSLPQSAYRQQVDYGIRDLIQQHYHLSSMRTEGEISRLQVEDSNYLASLLSLENDLAVPKQFCRLIFADLSDSYDSSSIKQAAKTLGLTIQQLKIVAFQIKIETTMAAYDAASINAVATLRQLARLGVDLNEGDYDKRTPLHIAAGAGNIETVRYLIAEYGAKVNPVDRWGATPMNDAANFPMMKALLLSHGGVGGNYLPNYKPLRLKNTDNQYRFFYAAFAGDVVIMAALKYQLGWEVNGQDYDGRTALSIASSEGHLEVVKYLISEGADIQIKDARGFDPLDEAIREGRLEVADYLINEALVRNQCVDFQGGLLNKGLTSTIGYFHKKFSDLEILAGQFGTSRNSQVQLLLGNARYQNVSSIVNLDQGGSTVHLMEVFLSAQELYLYKLVDLSLASITQTFQYFSSAYGQVAKIIFYFFLSIQLVSLFILRSRLLQTLKADVMQNRGILNLVPQEFFRKNHEAVERIVKTMRN